MPMIAALTAVLLAATPGTQVDVMGAYAGKWRVQIVERDTSYSKAHTETTTLVNACWRSGEFQVCHQTVDGESRALLVYVCASDSCTTYPVAPGTDTVRPGKLLAHGAQWIFPWQEEHDGKTIDFRVVNEFSGADVIEYRREYSTDRHHWTLIASGREQRVP